MLARRRPYTPEIAAVVNEPSFLYLGWGSGKIAAPLLLSRRPFDACGATYGQYFLDDVLDKPIDAKLFYLPLAYHLTEAQKAKLAALKAACPDAVFVEPTPGVDRN